MELISVIVPVYKVEKYLRKCVDSILAQTYTNLEIILVDDGSPDNCGKICDEYAEKDPRIKVIHQENGGLSAARNSGLDIATGKYVSFIDSDDYIDSNYYECMTKHLNDDSIVVSSVIDEDESGRILHKKATDSHCYSTAEALSAMCRANRIGTSACDKLVPLKVADNNRFPVGKIYEDLFTVYKWIVCSDTVRTIFETSYHYVHRFGSITNNTWNSDANDIMVAAKELLNYVSLDYPACYKDAVYRYFLSAHYFIARAYSCKDYKKLFKPYQIELKALWKDLIKNNLSVKDKIKFSSLAFYPPFHKVLFFIKQNIQH